MPRRSAPPALDPRPLACPVRGCALGLALEGRTLRCARGHAFDLTRRGAANLLQPQDRRSREPGDAREAVLARARVLEGGLGLPLADALVEALDALGLDEPRVLDAGCGTGWFLGELAARRAIRGVGVDLSGVAIDRAARDHPRLTWIVANADRRLPLADSAFDLALSITGPKGAAELRRVLSPAGRLVLVVPAPDDLIELRRAVLGEGSRIERAEKALALLAGSFELEGRAEVRSRPRLEPAAQRDLLASTYRAGRASREERAADLAPMEVTLAYELLSMRPVAGGPPR